jgi:C4-dicarboxylate-specific signal transduction histidine kinase
MPNEELAREGLDRLDRRLRTLCRCSEICFQAESESEALQSICTMLVEGDEFPLAWIGYCEDDAERTIRPVASAGKRLDFPERVKNSWGTVKNGEGPPGIAVRTGKPSWINDIPTASSASAWAAVAAAAGYNSCIALPLIARDRRGELIDLRGILNLFSAERDYFDDRAVDHYANLASCLTHAVAALRGQLAEDLTSGMRSLRASEQRRRAEEALQKAQAELASASRLSTMAQVAASIAHEINQPLTAIVAGGSAASRWLAKTPPDLDKAQTLLNRVVMEGHRASQVIESIRAMFRQTPREKDQLDANDLIREVLAFSRADIQRCRAVLETELTEKLPPLSADRVQLQQVMRNLIMNALEAMDAVTDRTRVLTIRSGVYESSNVLITVEDSGTGIEPKDMRRIFDSFFTTKPHGMGMGLAICRSIIEAHDGSLSAAPGHPHGTVFRVVLPTAATSEGG